MKIIAKTESYSEFLARGGKVTKCPTKTAGKKLSRKLAKDNDQLMTDADWAVLPAALKISFGIKS